MRLFLAVASFFLAACATVGEQTQTVVTSPPDVPPVSTIENVPYLPQSDYQCGPSTLAMAMHWAGSPATADELSAAVFTQSRKGSLKTDLVSASRHRGLMAIPIRGFAALLKEVAAGHPVIVFENLGFSWYPSWHYAIVFGYDLPKQEVLMHTGKFAFRREPFNYFERSWKLGEYWGLVVLPAGALSRTADELEHLKAAVGIEQANQLEKAELAYRGILGRWPRSLGALIGLGNLAYGKKNFADAISFLRKATLHHPGSKAAQNNFEIALAAEKQTRETRKH